MYSTPMHPQSGGLGSAGHRATPSYSYLSQLAPHQPSVLPGYYLYLHQHAVSHERSQPYGFSNFRGAPVLASMQMHLSQPPSQCRSHLNHRSSYPSLQHPMMPALAAALAPGFAPGLAPAPSTNAVAGGIKSVLEYSLPVMSQFLSWCAFGMLKQNRLPTLLFEKRVQAVLFATRLPKLTIVVALEYMNQRFSVKPSLALPLALLESCVFNHLLVALMLANKFNDDNTFTNKLWCGATGLSLAVVNSMEREWLQEIAWRLSVVPFEANIVTLNECWKAWTERRPQASREDEYCAPLPAAKAINSSPISGPVLSFDYGPAPSLECVSAVSSYPLSPAYDDYYYTTDYRLPHTPTTRGTRFGLYGSIGAVPSYGPVMGIQGQLATPPYYLRPPPPINHHMYAPMPYYNQATC